MRTLTRLVATAIALGVVLLCVLALTGTASAAGDVVLVDTLGSATPSSTFSAYGSGGQVISAGQLVGPQFTVTVPTVITEIGGFVNNCGGWTDHGLVVGTCPGTLPLTVEIRPAHDGVPDKTSVLATFLLSQDNDPVVVSYESTTPNFTLEPGTYFALFDAQDDDVGGLLQSATSSPFLPGSTVLGYWSPPLDRSNAEFAKAAVRILGRTVSDELAPNPDFEQNPIDSYFSNGPCSFRWATDQAHSPTHSLKITSTTSTLCRWLSQTQAIPATPGTVYDASALFKTDLVQSGFAYLSVNFWTAAGVYIPATTDSPRQLTGTQDWTPLVLQAKAPPGAAFVRLEFRLSGRGTVWVDDAVLIIDGVDVTRPETMITAGFPDGTILPSAPVSFSFTADKPGSGFACSLDSAPFAICSSPIVYSGLAPGPHTFAVRAIDPAGITDSTPATRSWTTRSDNAANIAPDPNFHQDPAGSYFTSGDGSFSWSNTNGHDSFGFLRIVSTSFTLNRWLSQTSAIRVIPATHYRATVWAKTQDVSGKALLSINFWTAAGVYIPATVDSTVQLSGTQDWTQLAVEGTAPAGATFMRVEFRLTGPGTMWVDDVDVTG